MSEIKLKPCPFCGETEWWSDRDFHYLRHEQGCYLYIDGNPEMILVGDTKHQKKWNRRAEVKHER